MARGRSRSARVSQVVDTVKSLESKGLNEIVVSGINLGDFKNERKETFLDLLIALDRDTNIPRIRLSSIEPNLLSDKIIEFISSSSRYLPHFHIPLQSGSDRILRLMKRRYSKKLYMDRIESLKEKIPNVCIGVDVITGFPSEEESDFQETYDFLSNLGVSYLHVFPYSERENTKGINLDSKVPHEIKMHRSKKLRQLSDILKSKFILKNLNLEHSVLIEGVEDEWAFGYSENYIKVLIKNNNIDINDIVNIETLETRGFEMIGVAK